MVRIVVEEARRVYQGVDYIQKSVEYKGFDEFREIIRKEEFKKLEKQFHDMDKSLDETKKNLLQKIEDITKISNSFNELTKKHTDQGTVLDTTKAILNDELKIKEDNGAEIQRLRYLYDTTQKAFDDLVKRKVTFWYWLKTKYHPMEESGKITTKLHGTGPEVDRNT